MKEKELVEAINSLTQTPSEYDVKFWRSAANALIEQSKSMIAIEGGFLYEKLGQHDSYYLTAQGYLELRNVVNQRAGLGPTKRAYNALVKYVPQKKKAA